MLYKGYFKITVGKHPLSNFEKQYDELYAKKYGRYRIIRIKEAVEKFLECGDYSKGIEGLFQT